MLSLSKLWFRRLVLYVRLFTLSWPFLGYRHWRRLWFTRSENIEIAGRPFFLSDGSRVRRWADFCMAWEVFRERVYDRISEPDTAVAVDDRVIVDIGAHIGSFSVLAAQQTRGRANIFAYEPSPHLYDLLQKNIAGLEKVKALHCAVAGENGQLMLYLNPLNPAQNSLVRKTAHGVSVPAISLETLFRKHQLDHIDLLKVDCEGGEYAIFTAGEAQLPRIHRIVMEVHDPAFFAVEGDYSITGLQALLRRHNFAVKYRALDDYSGLLYARNLQFNGDGNTESLS